MNSSSPNPKQGIKTSSFGFRADSAANDTGFAATTSQPDSLAEISRQWIFEEGYFLDPHTQFSQTPWDEIEQSSASAAS